MKLLHIVGRKNHGKTTFLVELVRELTLRSIRVGTIKHSSHGHELDTPGKDSHRHRTAGAVPAAVVTPELVAVFEPRRPSVDTYQRLAGLYAACDLVLVEGDIDATGRKVEVWRRAVNHECLALQRRDIAAVITDDPIEAAIPTLPRHNVASVCDWILQFMDISCASELIPKRPWSRWDR